MRALLAVAALAAVVLACSEEPNPTLGPAFDEATPAEPPKGELLGGCPDHFDLAQAYKVQKDMRYVGRDPADDNLDKWICIVTTKQPVYAADNVTLKSMGVTVLIDNNIPPDKLGKCPMSFAATVAYAAAEDLNRNSVVCKAQTEEEGLVVVDDIDS
jgi:hypothetical protein